MKIALVTDSYYPYIGGIQRYVDELANIFSERHEVHILTQEVPGYPEIELRNNVTIHRMKSLINAESSPLSVLKNHPQLSECFRELKLDIIHTNNHCSLGVIKAAKVSKIPVIYCVHGYGLLCPKHSFIRNNDKLCDKFSNFACVRFCNYRNIQNLLIVNDYRKRNKLIKSSDGIIVPSKQVSQLFEIEKNNLSVIYHGVDINRFFPVRSESFKQKYDLDEYILVIARLIPEKGIEYAIRAIKEINSKLVIIGDYDLSQRAHKNPYLNKLYRLVETLEVQNKVLFLQFQDHCELIKALSGASVTLIPSIWREPFGLIALESLACGTPVIITHVCGVAELLDTTVGRIIKEGAVESIIAALHKVLPNSKEMGKRGRTKVKNELTWTHTAVKTLSLYERILKQNFNKE
ncbi:MAG: glycosyltransferase family 4 protein [Promethearchaeota archaeon]